MYVLVECLGEVENSSSRDLHLFRFLRGLEGAGRVAFSMLANRAFENH